MNWLLALAIGYAFGSIPFGLIVARLFGLGDVRTIGSGNIGATNVLRTGSKPAAILTLLLDGLKGAAGVLAASQVAPDLALLGGLGAIIGHVFPVWLGFKGGKGVATLTGALLAQWAWPIGALFAAVWLLLAIVFRLASLASLCATATALVLFFLIGTRAEAIAALVFAALIFWAHRANISRLLSGAEPRIGEKKTP